MGLDDMAGGKERGFFVEIIAMMLVIFSAISLYVNEASDEINNQKLATLSGDVELSTRDSMDAFGLHDFKPGANAKLTLSAKHLESNECRGCEESVVGIQLYGSVLITELLDQENRLGRVEGILNFTHLATYSGNEYVLAEQINFVWHAGDITSSWELYVVHNPPRWVPEFDIDTLFVETPQGLESRSGPELLIKKPSENVRIIHACLPDSFLCRSTAPDAVLIATYNNDPPVEYVDNISKWQQLGLAGYPTKNATNMFVSEIFSLENNIGTEHGFTPFIESDYSTATSFDITGDRATFTPLSAWLHALNLMPLEFNTEGDTLVCLTNETTEIYNILSNTGSLRMGLIIY